MRQVLNGLGLTLTALAGGFMGSVIGAGLRVLVG